MPQRSWPTAFRANTSSSILLRSRHTPLACSPSTAWPPGPRFSSPGPLPEGWSMADLKRQIGLHVQVTGNAAAAAPMTFERLASRGVQRPAPEQRSADGPLASLEVAEGLRGAFGRAVDGMDRFTGRLDLAADRLSSFVAAGGGTPVAASPSA